MDKYSKYSPESIEKREKRAVVEKVSPDTKITHFTPLSMEDTLVNMNESSLCTSKSAEETLDAIFQQKLRGKLYLEVLDDFVTLDNAGNLKEPLDISKRSARNVFSSGIAKTQKPDEFWSKRAHFSEFGDEDSFRIYGIMEERNQEMLSEAQERGEEMADYPINPKGDKAMVALVYDRSIEKGKPEDRFLGAIAYKGSWTLFAYEAQQEQKLTKDAAAAIKTFFKEEGVQEKTTKPKEGKANKRVR